MMKYVLLDISGIIYRSFFGLNVEKFKRSVDGLPTNAIYGTIKNIKQLNKKFPDHIFIACCDSKRNDLIRLKENETYKENRVQTDENLVKQFDYIFQVIESMNIQQCKQIGYEADDIIASICKKYSDANEIIIVSSDKDMNQLLVYKNVQIYNPSINSFFTNDDCFEKFGIYPDNFTFYQAFVGDRSDNISGIKGVGPKTAIKLINKYKNIDNFVKANDHKYKNEIEDFMNSLYLVTLNTDIEVDIDVNKKQTMKGKKFESLCNELEIKY